MGHALSRGRFLGCLLGFVTINNAEKHVLVASPYRLQCDKSFCVPTHTAFWGHIIRREFAESRSVRFSAARLGDLRHYYVLSGRICMSILPRSRDHGMASVVQGSPQAAQDFLLPSPPLWANSRFSPPSWVRRHSLLPRAGRRGWTVWRREWATGPREECRTQALPSGSSSPTSSHACAFFEISTFWRIPQSPPLTWGLFLGPGANTDVKRLIWR